MINEYSNEIIIQNTLLEFRMSDEYEELQSLYQNNIKRIKNKSVISKLRKIEKVLHRKNQIEIIYAYQKGVEKFKENENSPNCFAIEDFTIDIVNFNLLYNKNPNYHRLEELLKKMRNNLLNEVNGNIKRERIEGIFEVHSYCNYEIIKHAYILGVTPIILLPSDTLSVEAEMIGQKLKKCRKDAQLTQSNLSGLLDINSNDISDYERGKSKPPISVIMKCSKIFNISLLYFLDDTIPID